MDLLIGAAVRSHSAEPGKGLELTVHAGSCQRVIPPENFRKKGVYLLQELPPEG